MRKSVLYIILALLGGSSAMAQSKIDGAAMRAIYNYEASKQVGADGAGRLLVASPPQRVPVIVSLAAEATAADLEALGAEVVSQAADMVVCNIDMEALATLADSPKVAYVSWSRERAPLMELARESMNTDAVHQGTDGLDHGYTGKGVMVGLVDTGLDPAHLNFRGSDDVDVSRVQRVFHFASSNGKCEEYNSVWRFDTDTSNEYHGTHVLGIMAGNYKGASTVATIDDAGDCQVTVGQSNPFYGAAPDADIAISCMATLSDANIMAGAQKVVQYAKEQGMPCVLNLSLGGITGPHDESDPLGAYLAALGNDAIICVAAGNDGDKYLCADKVFTADNGTLGTAVQYVNRGDFYVTLISDDDRDFTLTVSSVTPSGAQPFQYTVPLEYGVYSIGRSSMSGNYITDDGFDAAFTDNSYLQISVTTTKTNRYTIEIEGYLISAISGTRLGLEVQGHDGQHVNIWSSKKLVNANMDGWVAGGNTQSISSMACGGNVVVVGSYNTTNQYAALDGNTYSYAESSVGKPVGMTSFSSYGTLVDGTTLPHILGPGCLVVSSINSYYVERYGGSTFGNRCTAKATDYAEARDYYWGGTMGTSMACPAVAGTIATWLEANPYLTIDDVHKILKATGRITEDLAGTSPVATGAGKIDALAGIKMALSPEFSGISPIYDPTDGGKAIVVTAVGHNAYEAFAADASAISAQVYDMAGRQVMGQTVAGQQATVDLSALSAGVYTLRFAAGANSRAIKVMVK